MSDITPHSRDDLVELPCDCPQPADTLTPTHGPSYYLTLPCRSLAQAVTDISRYRDLPDFVWELLRGHRTDTRGWPTAAIVSLATERLRRAGR
jgi:hypothetical protein